MLKTVINGFATVLFVGSGNTYKTHVESWHKVTGSATQPGQDAQPTHYCSFHLSPVRLSKCSNLSPLSSVSSNPPHRCPSLVSTNVTSIVVGPSLVFVVTPRAFISRAPHSHRSNTIHPNNQNQDFVRGLSVYPKISRVPPYLGSLLSKSDTLRSFLWCKLWNFDQIFQGSISASCTRGLYQVSILLAELCAEPILLHWPTMVLGKILARYPRKNRSDFALLVRKLGELLTTKQCSLHRQANDLRTTNRRDLATSLQQHITAVHDKFAVYFQC